MQPNETKEEQTDSNSLVEEASKPASTQPSLISMRNLLDSMNTVHKASMSRTDASQIIEGLCSITQHGERQAQHSRFISPSIISFLGDGQ